MSGPAYDSSGGVKLGGDDGGAGGLLPEFLTWRVIMKNGAGTHLVMAHQMTVVDGKLAFYVIDMWKGAPITKIVRALDDWADAEEVPTPKTSLRH